MTNCVQNIDRKKAFEMILGIVGINVSFLIVGVLYEKITSTQYENNSNNQLQPFRITAGFIMVERFLNYLFGLIYRHFTLSRQRRTEIPKKNSSITGFMIFLSSIVMTESMYLVSYPFIIMSKSCNLISVILVGLLCSRVRSKQLKLTPQKMIVALIVTIGIIVFRVTDPSANWDEHKQTQLIGLFLLFVSLIVDGFIPDFQAQIKDKYKPQPIQMLIVINKWTAICSFFYLLISAKFITFCIYAFTHHQFMLDLLMMSVAAFVGQIFIYRMIKEFKQHIVPFVITTRKNITVALSLVYFEHQTSYGQIIAIIVVFATTVYEFLGSIMKSDQTAQLNEEKLPQKIQSRNDISNPSIQQEYIDTPYQEKQPQSISQKVQD